MRNRKGPVRIVVAYFQLPARVPACDVLRLRNTLEQPSDRQWRNTVAQTLLIDLRQSDGELLRSMSEGTRYEIRRAEAKDNLRAQPPMHPGAMDLANFKHVLETFASRKGISSASRGFLEQLSAQGALYLSCIEVPPNCARVDHAHLVDGQRARLLYSTSTSTRNDKSYQAVIGRANRLLHWKDMCAFRGSGCVHYDFGGIHLGDDEPALVKIAQFKMSFGGKVTSEFKCIRSCSWIGRLAMKLYDRLGR
ncbi:MAG: hypothetical protein L0387_36770 [Acidobacteria bacterium]|nr:hypothetical protein [Acidobacteriota bacterium]